jgi:distribution and morphology protein 31
MFVQYLKEKLTEQTGVNITVDQVKGSWKEGTLKLHNVKVVRDPSTFPEGQDRNVSIMDLSVELIAVKVSLLWFLQGKGWLKDVSVSGVRGTIDRRFLDWSGPPLPPRTWQRGDFVFENLLLSNVELGMFNPTPNRELKIKLHVLDCGRVRRQWLLHDLLSAKSVYGIFDGSLFSLTRSLTDSDKIKVLFRCFACCPISRLTDLSPTAEHFENRWN